MHRWILSLISALLLGCSATPKHLLPVSDDAKEQLANNGVMAGSPLYVRIFKKENEMELWLHSPYGYVPFKTYEICRWSGGAWQDLTSDMASLRPAFQVENDGTIYAIVGELISTYR